MEDDPNGRRPQNIKCRISPQPLVGFYPNFKLSDWTPDKLEFFFSEDIGVLGINGRAKPDAKV